ncbi:hypothetical protein GOP47_0009539 [Adiantum capillus-veneris]|uniref:non-specific serine/threonine protein kinase n=1 Tax=Adiantum capillus-veneris TaxID=13818 RepID=A0A9D4UWR5_ADICA|nr:hypothetical protein GOP47_0009539 [Adiantum capillus-veneris]
MQLIHVYSVTTSSSISTDARPFPSLLELSVGLNLSALKPTSQAAIRSLGDDLFFPILSSSSFYSTNSSHLRGFSLGFLFSPVSNVPSLEYYYIDYNEVNITCHIYLALCTGILGNFSLSSDSRINDQTQFSLTGAEDSVSQLLAHENVQGFVAPVWVANPQTPLMSVDAALVVVGGTEDSMQELQLRDYDGRVVWRVSDAGRMEVQDAGNLLIRASQSRNSVVWQSSTQPTDILLQGQKLMVGMQLTSNGSSDTARMEQGGLVLYLNTSSHPSPYWIFPIFFRSGVTNATSPTLNTFIHSSPCSNNEAYSLLGDDLGFTLAPGSCSNNTSSIYADKSYYENSKANLSWSFLRLEEDGRLYAYEVEHPAAGIKCVGCYTAGTGFAYRKALDSEGDSYIVFQQGSVKKSMWKMRDAMPFVSSWGQCNVPLACGPLAVCTPGSIEGMCSCPPHFEQVNNSDASQGCKRALDLPHCKNGQEHINTTDFLELNKKASISLFNGWSFAITFATLEDCKVSCTLNCSCNGFFHYTEENRSTCHFMNDEISLLQLYSDQMLSSVSISDPFSKVGHAETGRISRRRGSRVVLIAVLSSSVACLVLGLVATFSILKARKKAQSLGEEDDAGLLELLPLLPSRFSYQDLMEATKEFKELLGEGACGAVYAGELHDGRKVAVKVLKGQTKQFLAEVATIGRTFHVNVVRLLGFCWNGPHRLLVYEYVERGSLDRWLFTEPIQALAPSVLDWKTRNSIALGIAHGLSYLHGECTAPILHFDIKPQNILLDEAFVAKLADFGLSRMMKKNVSHVVTTVRGTPGYIAPEWLAHGAVTTKSDVYSMGMVMLEIVSGRKNVDLLRRLNGQLGDEEEEAWHFPTWAARKCEEGLMMELVDARLQLCGGFDEEQAKMLIYTAFWCIQQDPILRPHASTVVEWLEAKSCAIADPPFSTAGPRSHAAARTYIPSPALRLSSQVVLHSSDAHVSAR